MEDMGNYGYTLFRTIPGKVVVGLVEPQKMPTFATTKRL